MNRWLCFSACILIGLAMVTCGLLVPAHLRAVDVSVVQAAGKNTIPLIDHGLALASQKKLGAARMLLEAAQSEHIPGREKLVMAIGDLAQQNPVVQVWDSDADPARLGTLVDPRLSNVTPEPFTEFIIHLDNRDRALDFLQASPNAAVQALLKFRDVTNTVLFPPSSSSSGQALDAALATCGLLMQADHFNPRLANSIYAMALQASHGESSRPLELVLMDLMSLGQRFNWGQLAVFTGKIESPEALRLQAGLIRRVEARLPVYFAAVQLSDDPAGVANYYMNFSQTGLRDLGESLQYGTGGVKRLLQSNRRLHESSFSPTIAMGYSLNAPTAALGLKFVLYLCGGFLLALGLHFARPEVPVLEQPLQVRGFHIVREILLAVGFLLVVLFLSEPFLALENQKVDLPFRLHLPTVGGALLAGKTGVKPNLMNPPILLTLLLFFALQGLLYLACIFKLAEIQRQSVPPRIKLRLLENEDHLFDAGLYLGFVGTIVSLILVSMGVIQFSLMAAYSSTSFGIVFVCIFKIFHLRPARRKMLLEAEAAESPAFYTGPTPAPTTPARSTAPTLAVHL
jgi:hypothetical protein